MQIPLIDSHCHLDFPSFDIDRAAVLERARNEGVVRVVTVGAGRGVEGTRAALQISREHPGFVHSTAGLHPHQAGLLEKPGLWEEIAALAASPEVVAVGETGLDFFYDNAPREAAREAFRRQIALAVALKKPLVVHTRCAREDTLALLREEGAARAGGVIHCFSEDWDFARRALDLGFCLSFSGIVTFPKAVEVHEAARKAPEDSILVETDAPYLAPVPRRGRRNQPAYTAHTAAHLARLRGRPFAEFAAAATRNTLRLFGLETK